MAWVHWYKAEDRRVVTELLSTPPAIYPQKRHDDTGNHKADTLPAKIINTPTEQKTEKKGQRGLLDFSECLKFLPIDMEALESDENWDIFESEDRVFYKRVFQLKNGAHASMKMSRGKK